MEVECTRDFWQIWFFILYHKIFLTRKSLRYKLAIYGWGMFFASLRGTRNCADGLPEGLSCNLVKTNNQLEEQSSFRAHCKVSRTEQFWCITNFSKNWVSRLISEIQGDSRRIQMSSGVAGRTYRNWFVATRRLEKLIPTLGRRRLFPQSMAKAYSVEKQFSFGAHNSVAKNARYQGAGKNHRN